MSRFSRYSLRQLETELENVMARLDGLPGEWPADRAWAAAQKLAAMREALEFYAAEGNWDSPPRFSMGGFVPATRDAGARARAALASQPEPAAEGGREKQG